MWEHEPISIAAFAVCALAWLGVVVFALYVRLRLARSERPGTVVDRREVDRIVALRHRIELFEDEDRAGYYAEIPALDGCLAFAETAEEALKILWEIKTAWAEVALERGWEIPEPIGVEARD